jgi:hypothetical protein
MKSLPLRASLVLLTLICFATNLGVVALTTANSYSNSSSNQIIPTVLSNQPGIILPDEQSDPVVNQNNVYVAWNANLTTEQVYFSSSSNNGKSFSAPADLSSNFTANSSSPRVAAYGPNVYVIWLQYTSSTISLMFTVSHDNGTIFYSPVPIDSVQSNECQTRFERCEDIWEPQIMVIPKALYLLWALPLASSDSIYFTRSFDNGTTFRATEDLTPSTNGQEPYLDASADYVYVAWDNSTINNIYNNRSDSFITVSSNYGHSFGPAVDLTGSLSSSTNSVEPTIAVCGADVYVVWKSDVQTLTNWAAYISVSHDHGASFSNPKDLSNAPRISREVIPACSKNYVYVVWRGNQNGSYDVYFTRSSDYGSVFSSPVDISGNTNIKTLETKTDRPIVVADGSDVYVTWDSVRSGTNYVVYLGYSTNHGQSFKRIRISSLHGQSNEQLVDPLTKVNGAVVVWKSNSSVIADYFRLGS